MSFLRATHIGLCVSDLARSIEFYTDVLGFSRVSQLEVNGEPAETLLGLKDVKLEAVYVQRDGITLELLHYASPGHVGDGATRAMNALGFTHLSLRVADLEALLEKLRVRGVRVLEESAVFNPKFNAGAIFVTDPDGTRIELVSAPGDPSRLPGS